MDRGTSICDADQGFLQYSRIKSFRSYGTTQGRLARSLRFVQRQQTHFLPVSFAKPRVSAGANKLPVTRLLASKVLHVKEVGLEQMRQSFCQPNLPIMTFSTIPMNSISVEFMLTRMIHDPKQRHCRNVRKPLDSFT